MTIKLCIALYIFIMTACVITSINIYIKAKKKPVLYSLMICQALIFLWLFLAIFENMAMSVQEALFIDRIILFPISFLGGFWLIFSLYYCEKVTKRNRCFLLLILLPLVLLYIPALTKDYFHLIIVHKVIGENGWTEWGIIFYINYIITFVYSISGIILVVKKSLKEYRYIKLRKLLIIIAVIIPITVNIIASIGLIKTPFDYTPVSFSIWFILLSIAIFKYRLLDITPVAINRIFSSMEEAILIINNENHIVDYNIAVVHEFIDFFDTRDLKSINDFLLLLKTYAEDSEQIDQLLNALQNYQYANIEYIFFTLHKPQDKSIVKINYCLSIKPLIDDSDNRIGSIISFKNVSEFKRVTLANERSRLSGDIHDTLGNCIMSISANLKYAIEKFSDSEEILICLKQAHSAATGGILYLRQIVEELTPIDIDKYGLIWALQSLFKKLESAGATIDFHYSSIDEKTFSKTKYANIIYKTCQEALNNSFYHGKAKEISINLLLSNNEIKLYISDDGTGCSNIIKSRGLSGIEENVKSVGGKVDFGSPSDGGFNIRIVMPYQSVVIPPKDRILVEGGSNAKSIDS